MIDLAEVIERLVPQAAYGTARKTDIDESDYAALVRTWADIRTIPTLTVVEATRSAMQAERDTAEQNRIDRRNELLTALSVDPGPITVGEISAIDSLTTAKVVMLKMNRTLRIMRAVLAMLRSHEDVAE